MLIIKLEAFILLTYDKNQFGLASSNDKTSSDATGMVFVEFMHQRCKEGEAKERFVVCLVYISGFHQTPWRQNHIL